MSDFRYFAVSIGESSNCTGAMLKILGPRETQFMQLASRCRENIKQTTDHLLENEQKGDKARAVWTWVVTLSTLAWDISGSIDVLITLNEFRAARILCRSIMDYAIRLEYYAKNPDEAKPDLDDAEKWMRKYLRPLDSIDHSNDPNWLALQKFLAEDQKPRPSKTEQMLRSNIVHDDPVRADQLVRYLYGREYSLGSALSHGNPGALPDVFFKLDGSATVHQWRSRGVGTSRALLDYARDMHMFVRALAIATGLTDVFDKLNLEMQAAFASQVQLEPGMAFRKADIGDRAFVEHVFIETQRHIIEALFGWRGDEIELGKFGESYDLENSAIILVEGEQIGWFTVQQFHDHVHLHSIYLRDKWQRRGIGTRFIRGLIRGAEAAQVPLRLSTAKINDARHLYARLGFELTREDEFKVHMEIRPGN